MSLSKMIEPSKPWSVAEFQLYRPYISKFVNDNIVHPIKQPLVLHPLLGSSVNNIDSYFIDCYYLDRRVHISIPKEPFPYKIYEYYDEDIEKQFGSDMKKNAEIAQKKSYNTIVNICNKYGLSFEFFGEVGV